MEIECLGISKTFVILIPYIYLICIAIEEPEPGDQREAFNEVIRLLRAVGTTSI